MRSRMRTYGTGAVLLCLALAFISIDQSNVGILSIPLKHELNLTESLYAYGVSLFSVGYMISRLLTPVLSGRLFGANWIGILMLGAGIVTATTTFAFDGRQFLVWRFLLGLCEGGAWPAMVLYIYTYYPEKWRVKLLRALGLVGPIVSAFGSLLTTQLLRLDGALGITGWKWSFLVAGVLSALVGAAIFISLRAHDAGSVADASGKEESEGCDGLSGSLVTLALLCLVICSINTVSYVTSFWGPKLLVATGARVEDVGALLVVPNMAGFFSVIAWSVISRRLTSVKPALGLMMVTMFAALLFASFVTNSLLWTIASLTVAAAAFYATVPMFWELVPHVTKAAQFPLVVGVINVVGSLAGIAIPAVIGASSGASVNFPAILGMAAFGALTGACGVVLLGRRRVRTG